jgi:putative FmdB family regulatory protein
VPIYDYVCGSCGHRFEVLRGINEAGPHQCPECGGPVARAFVPPTIHFKGSGWAKADRRATSAPTRRAGAGSSASGSSPSASSQDSGKPAADSSGAIASGDSSKGSDSGTSEKPDSSQTDR